MMKMNNFDSDDYLIGDFVIVECYYNIDHDNKERIP